MFSEKRVLPAHAQVILHLLCTGKSPLLVWRYLVDAVAHAYRRFLVGLGLGMGLPTTWKGDGRVESRQLQSTWGPSKYATLLHTVFRTGLLKPAYPSVWKAVCASVQSE